MSGVGLEIRKCHDDLGKVDLIDLRQKVYVEDQGRLESVEDMSSTFDEFDKQAIYLLGYQDDVAVAAVKVIEDGCRGLPCEFAADISEYRRHGKVVEFGHLITERRFRKKGIGVQMMKAALDLCYYDLDAKFITGDFFVEPEFNGRYHPFYDDIGFLPVTPVYQDSRFSNAPPSMVGVLDIDACIRSAREDVMSSEVKRFFFSGLNRAEKCHG